MLYFIGGPAKVGKSKLAEKLLQERNIPFLPTDLIMVILKEAGVNDFNAHNPSDDFFTYLGSIAKHLPYLRSDFCIEGNSFEPKHLKELEKSGLRDYQACFLGMSEADIDTILRYAGPETWLITDLSEEERRAYPETLVKLSKSLQDQCEELGFPYIDLAHDYETQLDTAFQNLVG